MSAALALPAPSLASWLTSFAPRPPSALASCVSVRHLEGRRASAGGYQYSGEVGMSCVNPRPTTAA
jgi:hypothetical protein